MQAFVVSGRGYSGVTAASPICQGAIPSVLGALHWLYRMVKSIGGSHEYRQVGVRTPWYRRI